jgi:H+-translocating NAD(P) transhydrogenase subunit alpha
MRIAVPTETDPGEARVAATPETVKKFVALGVEVVIESGAGLKSGIADADYKAAGAKLAANAGEALRDADVVLKVRRPAAADLAKIRRGAAVVAIMDPYGQEAALDALAQAGVDAFAMELMPRITRAQSMDVLSSQANLAGYRAVIDAAAEYGRAFPMMMTAAGTVPAAKAFVMGVGVAGLQAIATARRLGAIVTATDVRPATKEQVESLGAKFVAVEDDEFKQAEAAGGYAKEMSKEYQAKQAALVAAHIAKQDIVITTALIPGRPAPRLITTDMVKSMRRGSVIVDLAVERGGNCEASKPGDVATVDGVTILGHLNVASRLAATASALYARNLFAFLETLIDKSTKALAIKRDDEIVRATCLTRDGAVVHPLFAPKPAAGSEASRPSGATTAPADTAMPVQGAAPVPPIEPSSGAAATLDMASGPAGSEGEASADRKGSPAAPTVTIPLVHAAAADPVPSPLRPAPDAPGPEPSVTAPPSVIRPAFGPAADEASRASSDLSPAVTASGPASARSTDGKPSVGESMAAPAEDRAPAADAGAPGVTEPPSQAAPPIVIPPALSTAAYEASRSDRASPPSDAAPLSSQAAPAFPATPHADTGPIVEPAKNEASEKASHGQRDDPTNP